jgi:P-type Cu2+ transporter
VRVAAERASERGQASISLLTPNAAVAAITIADAGRPESREAIHRLHEQRIEVVMLTGDATATRNCDVTPSGEPKVREL